MNAPNFLTDVTLRDGLQAEAKILPTEVKVKLALSLLKLSPDRLELTSFVHPKLVPQLSDAEALSESFFRLNHPIPTMAFTANVKGLERLLKFPFTWVSTFVATTETFNQKNVNQPIADTLIELGKIVEMAHKASRKVRIYCSTFFGCPYEGDVSDTQCLKIFKRVVGLAPDEIALSDTIGVATPQKVAHLLEIVGPLYDLKKLAVHFHDTYGLGLASSYQALKMGISSFDGSIGSVGGCPFAKGATGNLALESLWYMLFRETRRSGLPIKELESVIQILKEIGLTPKSPIADILSKGGTVYGCK